mmetsp:Transcript_15074/g.15266  ORF Transcript_15074/g.15266 Transcript_15074/m.15266 type:complete len:217 (+) Transcript_15074:1500-2150(+)
MQSGETGGCPAIIHRESGVWRNLPRSRAGGEHCQHVHLRYAPGTREQGMDGILGGILWWDASLQHLRRPSVGHCERGGDRQGYSSDHRYHPPGGGRCHKPRGNINPVGGGRQTADGCRIRSRSQEIGRGGYRSNHLHRDENQTQDSAPELFQNHIGVEEGTGRPAGKIHPRDRHRTHNHLQRGLPLRFRHRWQNRQDGHDSIPETIPKTAAYDQCR